MPDIGHVRTDEILAQIEKQVHDEYKRAAEEVDRTYNEYMQAFARKDRVKQAMLARGEITQEYYNYWKHGQLCIGKRWREMRDSLVQDMVHADSIARSIYAEHMPEVYALNHNYATYQVEHDGLVQTSYTIYNRRAVENMIKNGRRLLPFDEDGPIAQYLREHKDKVWNQQKINTVITQGILQGQSNQQIAKRLQEVVGMNERAAIRNGRTMMTGVQNKARVDAYDDLKGQGIELREKWYATLDGRTRHSHRRLHGTYKNEDGYYKNDLRYPGDPDGDPEEVYNCRCTEICEVLGHSIETARYSPKMGDMSFDEWLKGGSGHPRWTQR